MSEIPVVLDVRVVAGAGGGPDKTILNSPRFLWPAYRNLCAYMHSPPDPGFEKLRLQAELHAAPLFSVSDRGPCDWRVASRLLDILRQERVRIWHGHDYKSNALGLFLRYFWPMHLVTTVHGWVHRTWRTPLYYGIDRACLRRYEKVICVSHDLHAECLARGVPAARCVLIENGIDLAAYGRTLPVEAAKESLGIPKGRLVIGAVGRLEPEKGFDQLIRAVDRLCRTGLDVGLLIIGDGSQEAALGELVAQLGRPDRFRLGGYQADPIPCYQAMDVFALSSLREGLPNVLLEAMALEVPVVATAVNGVPRLVQSEENGLLVEPGSIDALVYGLHRLLTDDRLRSRLARGGRHTVEEKYSFSMRMAKVRAVYDELMANGLSTGFDGKEKTSRLRPEMAAQRLPEVRS